MNPSEVECAPKVARMVRCARKLSGLTQKEVCSNLRISQSYLSKIEHGINVPSVVFWAEFCQLTGVNLDSVVSGYLDNMTFSQVESGNNNTGINIPQRYSYLRSMKIRGLNTMLFFAKETLGEAGFEQIVTEMGIDPDYFFNYDNQLNINFLNDFISILRAKQTNHHLDLSRIYGFINEPMAHGNFSKKIFADNDPISKIKKLIKHSRKYEANFTYEILEDSSTKLAFSIRPEEHLEEFRKNLKEINDGLLTYLSKGYLDSFTVNEKKISICEFDQKTNNHKIEISY